MRIEYRLTAEEVSDEATRSARLLFRTRWGWVAAGLVLLLMFPVMHFIMGSVRSAAAVTAIIAAVAVFALWRPGWWRAFTGWSSRLSLGSLLRRPNARTELRWVELTPVGLKLPQLLRDAVVPWKKIKVVLVTPDFIELGVRAWPLVRIPAHAFPDDAAWDHALELIESFLPDDAKLEYT